MLYIIEDEEAIIELFKVNFSERYDFEFITFRELLFQADAMTEKKNDFIVDISRNPNYLLICNRLRKLLADLSLVHFIVNAEQLKSIKNDSEIIENVIILKSIMDLESYFSSKLNYYRRR